MAKVTYRTEDEIRDEAKSILGFDKKESKIQQGTGQITTFNQLGFKGVIDKPDGWYLPDDCSMPAIILETKSEQEDISLQKTGNPDFLYMELYMRNLELAVSSSLADIKDF